jgi:hypothetical protein
MQWSPYFTIGHEETLPAGTRMRFAPGSVPPDTGTLLQRSITRVGDGTGSLSPTMAELRVVTPAGASEHRRQFLPASDYLSEDVRVLRKGDGTGFAMLVPDSASAVGSSLPLGDYRLRLSYRRDNRARDPESMVLSQAGDSGSEEVVVDVNWV